MALDDKIFRQTSPIKQKGMIKGSATAVPPVEKQDQPTTTQGKGRPPIDDEANLDEMERLISQGMVESVNAAATKVAELTGGQSVDSTARRLRRKYSKRKRWEKAGYAEKLLAIPNLPKPGIEILEDIDQLHENFAIGLLSCGYSIPDSTIEIDKYMDRMFGVYPEIITRLKNGEEWDKIISLVKQLLYDGKLDVYKWKQY